MTTPVEGQVRVAQVHHGAPAEQVDPCVIVIFGASGDLTRRKLIPALFHLVLDGAMPEQFAVIGVARDALSTELLHAGMSEALGKDATENAAAWQAFLSRLSFLQGEFDDPAMYAELQRRLVDLDAKTPESDGHLFYLAIPPDLCATVIGHLAGSGVLPRTREPQQRPWARVIFEKPFGHDLASARALNTAARAVMSERQIYRIDHYLGKESVQNLLVLRFANSIFEPLWNRHHIQHVQITTAEAVGVEHRAGYYEQAGVVRDMFQNHLMQLLALTAMEAPASFDGEAVRDEKVKLLHAVRPFDMGALHECAVRGQYGPGTVGGVAAPGYREEERVASDSPTPTFAAIRLMIDNWRWHGVPFFLRSGKRLPTRATEIAIQFRRPPHLMFPIPPGKRVAPNVLAIRVQPTEGVGLRFEVKVPGFDVNLASVEMDFDATRSFDGDRHDAYETLLLDAMQGDQTLFTRSEESETAWELIDPIVAAWENNRPAHFPNYPAGSWGPAAADELIARIGATWRKPG